MTPTMGRALNRMERLNSRTPPSARMTRAAGGASSSMITPPPDLMRPQPCAPNAISRMLMERVSPGSVPTMYAGPVAGLARL